jgi:hypothetical protein
MSNIIKFPKNNIQKVAILEFINVIPEKFAIVELAGDGTEFAKMTLHGQPQLFETLTQNEKLIHKIKIQFPEESWIFTVKEAKLKKTYQNLDNSDEFRSLHIRHEKWIDVE